MNTEWYRRGYRDAFLRYKPFNPPDEKSSFESYVQGFSDGLEDYPKDHIEGEKE